MIPLVSATVVAKELNSGVSTDEDGKFRLTALPEKELTIDISFAGYKTYTQKVDLSHEKEIILYIRMNADNNSLGEVEVFGERYKQPEKLDMITRMPLRPSEQIQSISIISDKLIQQQGNLTLTDAVRNVPGLSLFGNSGGVRESLSSRGYRAIPILKNGVRNDTLSFKDIPPSQICKVSKVYKL